MAPYISGLLIVGSLVFGPALRSSPRPLAPRRAAHVSLRAARPLGPRPVPDGAVVELWHEGQMHVGNSRGLATPKTLEVELSSGEHIKVDGGQLVDVWPQHDDAPRTLAEWTALHASAALLLRQLPPHMLDLQPLWKQLTTQKGGRACVDSDAVAVALFADASAEPLAGQLARRVAAGQLLAEERVLFKRQQGQLVAATEADGAAGQQHAEQPLLDGGGFRPLPRAQAESLAEGLLLDGMRARLKAGGGGGGGAGRPVEWPPAVLPLLAELEMAALGVKNASRPLQRTLAALGEPPAAQGARQLLVRTGQWQTADNAPAAPEEEGASVRSRLFSVEPFPRPVLDAAAAAARAIGERRAAYRPLPLPAPPEPPERAPFAEHARLPAPLGGRGRGRGRGQGQGRGGPPPPRAAEPDALGGRVDLRGRCPRAYAIDADSTDFRDDALSLDLATGQLCVHIADLTGVVKAGGALDETARLRLQSIYASAMPLHMLPPSLLQHACLSADEPNECITAMLQLDAFGRVRHCQVVRSLVPPIRALSFADVDALLREDDISSQVYSELKAVAAVTRRRAEGRDRTARRAITGVRWRGGVEAGWRPELVVKTPARVAVDECLAMFSYAARGVAKRHNLLRLPQMERQRIATAPLRRYADLVAQRQLAAALRGEAGAPPGEVAALERRLQTHHRELQQALNQAQQPLMLRALESMCARQAAASGAGYAVLEATVVRKPAARKGGGAAAEGGGLQVRLSAGDVLADVAARSDAQRARGQQLAVGQRLRVRLRNVDSRAGRVQVELHD